MKITTPQFHNLKQKLGLIAIALFYLICLVSILYHGYYKDRAIPGTNVMGINVSGKTEKEISKLLSDKLKNSSPSATFKYNGSEYVISGTDVGLNYSVEETVEKIFKLGRTGIFIQDTKDKLAALTKGINLPPHYYLSNDALNNKVLEIVGDINIPYLDPRYVLDAKQNLVFKQSQEGRVVSKSRIQKLVGDTFISASVENYSLTVDRVSPNFSNEEVQGLEASVLEIISNTPVVKFEDKEWALNKEDLLFLIGFRRDEGKVQISVDKNALDSYASKIAKEVDRDATAEIFKVDGERVVEFKPKTDGRRTDLDKLKKELSEVVLSGDKKEIVVTANSLSAPENENKYGIFALIGEGVSYYKGSIPGRIKNLKLASERASGVLVPPGEVYSFNKTVGEISGKTGYDYAYIIQNGRTVLGEGGGVCQSSTTLFRAVLNAGLPIIKRSAHAYRVYYYEQKSELGMDATVFSPSVDFQFKNDTSGYILVQHEVFPDDYKLVFRIYGTPDGRKVEISKPVTTSQTPPPEPLYIDDPELPKGKVVQTDHAAWGAVVSFKRSVTKDGKVLHDDTFVSRYQAWRDIYSRGTKE